MTTLANMLVAAYATLNLLGKMLVVVAALLGVYIALMTAFWVDYKLKGGKRGWWAYIKHATYSKW